MVVWCKYCNFPVANYTSLQCESCEGFVHFNCLQQERPSRLEGDVLFDLTCKNCGGEDDEKIARIKMTWLQAIHLTLYNLSIRESGRQGFFKWKDDICTFISQHWSCLFPERPMSNNWRSTVAGTLSIYSAKLFKSGQSAFNETGWWGLIEVKPPPKNYGSEIKMKQNTKSKELKRKFEEVDQEESLGRGKRNIKLENDFASKDITLNSTKAVDLELGFDEVSLASAEMQDDFSDVDFSVGRDGIEAIVPTDDPFSLLKVEDLGKELSENLLNSNKEFVTSTVEKPAVVEAYEENSVSAASESLRNSSQEQLKEEPLGSQISAYKKLTPVNLVQEREILNRLNSCRNAVADNPAAMRLKRKLRLRKRKLEMGLPLFDLDDSVRRLIRKSAPKGIDITFTDAVGNELPKSSSKQEECKNFEERRNTTSSVHHPALQGINVLDRFRNSFLSAPKAAPNVNKYRTFLSRLVGCNDEMKSRPICSPYTQRVLKPFIRRDYETKPLKVRLMEELISFAHRYNQHWIKPCPFPIDYCYVQPHHIPAVNAMCEDFFWKGINLSECLQYPDFSCVVLYKKLLIGFAFMVPDVKYNEAYISFILVHPDWRGAGIGTFMIYHLIQTCMGKDVTLHVSASNRSIMLYQKFGFKAEEFILDFYDKYLPEDSSESKHAFFLRLRR